MDELWFSRVFEMEDLVDEWGLGVDEPRESLSLYEQFKLHCYDKIVETALTNSYENKAYLTTIDIRPWGLQYNQYMFNKVINHFINKGYIITFTWPMDRRRESISHIHVSWFDEPENFPIDGWVDTHLTDVKKKSAVEMCIEMSKNLRYMALLPHIAPGDILYLLETTRHGGINQFFISKTCIDPKLIQPLVS